MLPVKRAVILWVCLAILCTGGCRTASVRLPDAPYTVSFTEVYFPAGTAIQVHLAYPTLEGYADTAAAERMHTAALEYANTQFALEGLIASGDTQYTYSVNDTALLLATPRFLSVRIGGIITVLPGGNARYFAYTFNYDLSAGTILESQDVFSDYAAVKDLWKAGRFRQDFGYASLEKEISWEDMIAQYHEEYGVYPHVYFTEGRLGLLIDTVASLDGYAGFSIDIREVQNHLRTENPTIAFLCGDLAAEDS